jgi:hypothetical protein
MTQSPWSSIGCVQHDFRADGTFDTNCAPFLHQDYHHLQTDSNKLPLDTHHLGVSSGASKTNSEPMVRSAQNLLLYCTDSNTVSKRIETRFHMTHYLQTDSNKFPLDPRHLGVSSGVSKMISELIVCSVQTVHLYCTNTNTVSKRTKMRFHMTHSPRSSIGCVQHDIRVDGTLGTNRAPFSRQHYHYLQMDSNKLPLGTHDLVVSSGASTTNSKPMVRSAQNLQFYCTDTNTV